MLQLKDNVEIATSTTLASAASIEGQIVAATSKVTAALEKVASQMAQQADRMTTAPAAVQEIATAVSGFAAGRNPATSVAHTLVAESSGQTCPAAPEAECA
eukprot:4494731-Amphidinium_carterae.1